jgi:hypothetical protein
MVATRERIDHNPVTSMKVCLRISDVHNFAGQLVAENKGRYPPLAADAPGAKVRAAHAHATHLNQGVAGAQLGIRPITILELARTRTHQRSHHYLLNPCSDQACEAQCHLNCTHSAIERKLLRTRVSLRRESKLATVKRRTVARFQDCFQKFFGGSEE